ncbi:RpiB/LacA/LacB family sugar-phosphate isomerase [Mesomycoplasma hyorhinis]|uniref:RpiB/LacA/LacB family sugar-phosphate isomerase n=1 Tax=Mesomycoplasma hyorhinis TaxID=2100 RepID=UPI001C04F1A6|nr:RpiB/LacA/LacB family sugar-phosphate isomerase [Mesomycoplasma hyorhinis]UVT32256.1 RpiB/LacA/LacB family sugar-phosphate isomerase [Mesomycoplasma hyorhinis]UVT32933.1 RpiB/LacA/LacB family sugar-phosphate isomerase [Mesomycoplasma hyorhinis]UVT33609.1 RpiB/LacA/LacB family sugar-phosphate isomerase [Mesomycoplasma hyorhinis]
MSTQQDNKIIKIAFASDHAGFKLKDELLEYLKSKGYQTIDLGPDTDQQPSSYAFYGKKLAHQLLDNQADLGIGVCGTGLGISYALNRFKHIRAARIVNENDAYLAKLHNDANAIALSGRFTSFEEAKRLVDTFLATKYEGGRHQTRINELDTD